MHLIGFNYRIEDYNIVMTYLSLPEMFQKGLLTLQFSTRLRAHTRVYDVLQKRCTDSIQIDYLRYAKLQNRFYDYVSIDKLNQVGQYTTYLFTINKSTWLF